MQAYTEASFAFNDDMSSQIGYVILLCDDAKNCHVMENLEKKSKRVVRSIRSSELYALAELLDLCAMQAENIGSMLVMKALV